MQDTQRTRAWMSARVAVTVGLLCGLGVACHRQAVQAGKQAGGVEALTEEEQLAEHNLQAVPDRLAELDAATVAAAWTVMEPGRRERQLPRRYGETADALQKRVNAAEDGATLRIEPGTYEGNLYIDGKKGLTLTAQPGSVWLVSESHVADVLRIQDSENITVRGLGLLHRTEGLCSGDAIDIRSSKDVTLVNNDLSGSGVSAVRAEEVVGLRVDHNHIHHCTYNTVRLERVFGADVRNNLIRRNKEIGSVPEGIVLREVFGPVTIASNTFVDNASTPITLDRFPVVSREELSEPDIVVTRNLFRNSQSPRGGKRLSIWVEDGMRQGWTSRVDGLKVADNCFDTSGGRADLGDHVPGRLESEAEAAGNVVGELRLDDRYRVAEPGNCRGLGAPVVSWLDEARAPEE